MNPKHRFQPKDALDHEWFNKPIPYNQVANTLDIPEVTQLFKRTIAFKAKTKFELFIYQKCLQFSTFKMDDQRLLLFEKINTNHAGILAIDEFESELKKLELALPPSRLQVIVNSPPNGITFSQFVMLTTDFDTLLTPEMFDCLFTILDVNATKRVNLENVVSAFNRAAVEVNKEELKEI